MCLLTFLPPGVQPDLTALCNGAIHNNDGHGYAIVCGDRLVVQRSMDAAALIEAFAVDRLRYPGGPALFHSRLTTHGNTSLDNCHPFRLGGDHRTVLAHNGVLPAVVQPGKGDTRSDTRIAAEDYLPRVGSLRSRRVRLKVQTWMTRYNKMVILTVDRRYREQAYVLNEDCGIWHDGIWYSNDSYLPPGPSVRWHWGDDHDDTADWVPLDQFGSARDRCPFCRTVISLTEADCRACGWCLDCGEPFADCTCYQPAAPDLSNRTRFCR